MREREAAEGRIKEEAEGEKRQQMRKSEEMKKIRK